MTSDEISNLMVELEKKIKETEDNRYKIEFEINTISKDMLKMQYKKKELQMKLDEAKHVITENKLDLSMANKLYWKNKN